MPTISTIPTIAITGGKGGTGKTLVATNLAVSFAQNGYSVLLLDTDVENPNTNILLGASLEGNTVEKAPVEIFKPLFNNEKCTQCGLCRNACYRHAILQFPEHFPSVMEHMCSGCETCARICPENAIDAGGRKIGEVYFFPQIFPALDLILGELQPTEAVSVLVVESVLDFAQEKMRHKDYDLIIVDTAPGAHCDVEKSLNAADQIIAVTEPTPFGMHDLKRILELLKLNDHSASVILNRSDLSAFREPILEEFTKENLTLLGEIPVDQKIVENYARGRPFVLDPTEFEGKSAFLDIYHRIAQDLKRDYGTGDTQ